MFTKRAFVFAVVALFCTGGLQAEIFDNSGPDAPLILFDADDYNAGTGTWPNIGTGGSVNDASPPAGEYAFLNSAPYHVNSGTRNTGTPQEFVIGPPGKTADVFAGTHDGVSFILGDNQIDPDPQNRYRSGQGLIFDPTGLPKGTNRELTFFAVFNKGFNSKSGLIGYGKVEEECCLDEDDNVTLWVSTEQGPFPGYVEIGSDSGRASSDVGGVGYHAGTTMVASATVQSDDAVRFALWEAGGALTTVGPVAFNADLDNTEADLGHVGFYFDFRPRFMDGHIAMLAIVPSALNDTKRNAIVSDLYERYVNGGNEPLIMLPGGVPGDYNGNGIVDAADYTLWRDGGPLMNEVHNPGTVSAEDYDEWLARFGNTNGAAAGSFTATIPEPATVFFIQTAVCSFLLFYWRRRGILHG